MSSSVLILTQPHYTPYQQRLLNMMLDPKRTPVDRARAGRDINQLGDPRPGVLDFNFKMGSYWCSVPPGEYSLGSDDEKDDNPKHTAKLNAFYIAKYPITHAQFQTFINAKDGFSNVGWWQDMPANELARPPYDTADQRWKIANHPCEPVSWYEAVAFSRWLSEKLGYEVRLPTDDEWEAAARGTDEREYPWGNDYQIGYANGDERDSRERVGPNYLQRTTAVGIYPQHGSPYGALDLIGNIWEWTLTEVDVYRKLREVALSEFDNGNMGDISRDDINRIFCRIARSVRGGSWGLFDRHDLAHAASRTYFFGLHYTFRSYRNADLGFRLVSMMPL